MKGRGSIRCEGIRGEDKGRGKEHKKAHTETHADRETCRQTHTQRRTETHRDAQRQVVLVQLFLSGNGVSRVLMMVERALLRAVCPGRRCDVQRFEHVLQAAITQHKQGSQTCSNQGGMRGKVRKAWRERREGKEERKGGKERRKAWREGKEESMEGWKRKSNNLNNKANLPSTGT